MKRFLFLVLFLTALLGISGLVAVVRPANVPLSRYSTPKQFPDFSPGFNPTRFTPGETGSVTVSSPYSLDGASAAMWGFYKNSGGWVNTTYGTAVINTGVAVINYTIPSDFVSDFTWVIDVGYSADSNNNSRITYADGLWGQFSYDDPNGTTVNMKAYLFDQYDILSTNASYRVSASGGTVFPDPALAGLVVQVRRPWTGTWDEYLTPDIGYGNNPKTGLYPTYAQNLGYSIEVLDSHPLYPNYQKLRLYKDDIGYSVVLYGYKNTSGSDPAGYIWWTTLLTEYDYEANYNSSTGEFSIDFDTPLDLETMYFLDPYVWEYTDNTYTDYYYITVGGGTDLLLSGDYPTGPVLNVDLDKTYNTIQAAIDDPLTLPGHVIEVQPGTYTQTPSTAAYSWGLDVDKGVTIVSVGGAANTTIDCGGADMGIRILGNLGTVTIEGFTITNFAETGIAQSWSQSVGTASIIKNNIVTATNDFLRNGIQVSGSNSQVTGNVVNGASYINEDYGSSGILSVNGSNVLIQENTVNGADLGITVMNFDYYDTGQVVSSVTVNNNIVTNSLMTAIAISGIDEESDDQLQDITISNNTFTNNEEGVSIYGCEILAVTYLSHI